MEPEFRFRPTRPLSTGEKLWRVNWSLLAVVAAIACIGIAALYSVAGGSFTPWAEQHAIRLIIGLALIITMAVLPMRLWIGLAYPTYFAAFVPAGTPADVVGKLNAAFNAAAQTTLVLVTHEPALAGRCGRVLTMDGGALVATAPT